VRAKQPVDSSEVLDPSIFSVITIGRLRRPSTDVALLSSEVPPGLQGKCIVLLYLGDSIINQLLDIYYDMSQHLMERDFSYDYLRWLNRIDKISIRDTKDLDQLQREIIANNDPALAYFFAIDYGYQTHRMQKIILEKKDAKYAFLFAQNISFADVKALQQVVMESKSNKYICKFACFVKNADRKSLETIILKSKSVKNAHMYLKHVKDADVKRFKEIIVKSGKPMYLFELAKHLTDPKEITEIEDLIIASGSFTYMRLFAEKIKSSNIEKLERAVLDSDNVEEIKKFAKYVKRSKMKRFFLVL